MDKHTLSERDICTKFITPALRQAGWDVMSQIREEVSFTKGRIIVRGKLVSRGKAKRADYVLYYKPNIPLALIEAKDNSYWVGDGMQQGLDYATTLHIPFVFSSNGDGFVFHDRTGSGGATETNLSLNELPPPAELWGSYRPMPRLSNAMKARSISRPRSVGTVGSTRHTKSISGFTKRSPAPRSGRKSSASSRPASST